MSTPEPTVPQPHVHQPAEPPAPRLTTSEAWGRTNTRCGEALCAWVVTQPGTALSEDGLRAFCKGQIAHDKVPRCIRFVAGFPMTVTGKVQTFKIRDTMKDQLGLADTPTV